MGLKIRLLFWLFETDSEFLRFNVSENCRLILPLRGSLGRKTTQKCKNGLDACSLFSR